MSPKQVKHPVSETGVAMELNLWPGLGHAGLGSEELEETQCVWGTVRRQRVAVSHGQRGGDVVST